MLPEHTYILPSTKKLLGVLTTNSEIELNQKTADAIDAGSEGDTRHNTAFHSLTIIQQLASTKHIKLMQIEKMLKFYLHHQMIPLYALVTWLI